MNTDQGWNSNDNGNEKYLGKPLFQCYCAHHKYHMDCPRIEPEPAR